MTNTNINTEFSALFQQFASMADQAMDRHINEQDGIPETLKNAMLYSIHAGGKRLRPVMVMLACQACNGKIDQALPAASAIEMIHTYSLIHDDLPAMDNDDFRRGKPTNHKVYGEAQAILAGDGLLTFAFTVLTRYINDGILASKLVAALAYGAGAAGMVGGQSADILGEQEPDDLKKLEYIHTNKTARLFEAAMKMGALCANASQEVVDTLANFGLTLGLAFQVVDDLLDVTSTAEKMGKQVGKDAQAGKMTYPALIGIEQSKAKARQLYEQALNYLDHPGINSQQLRQLAIMLIDRDN